MENCQNVVLVGGPGTGKTHVATAMGVQAIQHHHKRVRFLSTIELVNSLEKEKFEGKPGCMANRLMHADIVILDKLYERTTSIITTNLSFSEWPTVFGDEKLTTV